VLDYCTVAVADLEGVPRVPWNPLLKAFAENLRISQPVALCFLEKYK